MDWLTFLIGWAILSPFLGYVLGHSMKQANGDIARDEREYPSEDRRRVAAAREHPIEFADT